MCMILQGYCECVMLQGYCECVSCCKVIVSVYDFARLL